MEETTKAPVCAASVHIILDLTLKVCTARGDMKVHCINYTCEGSRCQNFGLMNSHGSFYESNAHGDA